MRVVVAMNAFKGSLTSVQATRLAAEGFRRGFPGSSVVESPMADGGDGTLEVLVSVLGGRTETRQVTGPYGRQVTAEVGVLDDGKTVVIESARASGLVLAPPEERDIQKAQSRGVGELLAWAALSGASTVIVGIGGTAMNDGGIGAALAAGAKVLDAGGREVPAGLAGLPAVHRVSPGDIPRVFAGARVIGISDVKNVLCGADGATMVYGPQKGLSLDDAGRVDLHMARYGRILGRDLGRDPCEIPMAGAGGGLGAALYAFFRAELVDGAGFVMDRTLLREKMRGAQLVITGEGHVDSQTNKGKVPMAVAEAAGSLGVPTVVIGGGLHESVVRDRPSAFDALMSSTPRPMKVEAAMAEAPSNLAFTAEQLGRICRLMQHVL